MTKEQAREAVVQLMAEALDDCGEIDLNADELEEAANYAAEAVWTAPPEVLAAALDVLRAAGWTEVLAAALDVLRAAGWTVETEPGYAFGPGIAWVGGPPISHERTVARSPWREVSE